MVNKLDACLVGGVNPSEKMLVSWDYYSQYKENNFHVPNHPPENICML
jgi:hypothetical protein